MIESKPGSEKTAALRRKAEGISQETPVPPPEPGKNPTQLEIETLLHDLRVHQIELEMQNDELRRTQVELEKARARYFDIYDLAPVGYCTVSEEGIILEANLTTAEMLGADRRALTRQPLTHLIFREDQSLYYLHRKKLFETGLRQILEVRLVKTDGTFLWAHLAMTLVQDPGGAPLCRVTLSDTSRLKQAERDLKESKEKLEQVFEMLPVGISVLDRERRIVKTNPALGRILGISQAGMLGGDSQKRQYFRPDGSRMPPAEFASSRVKSGEAEVLHVETGIQKEDGEIVWVDVSAVAAPFSDWSIVIVTADLTDRKRAENEIWRLNVELEERVNNRTAQLEATNQELEASNQELEAFAYSISHDLRTPLRAINGYAHILRTEHAGQLDREGQRFLEAIKKNAGTMDQLITDLLALSRVSSHKLEHSRIDMTALVRAVYQEIASPETREKFTFEVTDLPPAYADPTVIRLVWENLISNAIKYSQPVAQGRIEIHGAKTGGECTYWIKDNGVGFNPQYTDQLFGLFQRLPNAGTFEGTGVGLAISQRIILRHGGKIWGESQPDNGATFYFSIPER